MSNVPLVIVNGKKVTREELEGLQPDEIEAINVIKDKKIPKLMAKSVAKE